MLIVDKWINDQIVLSCKVHLEQIHIKMMLLIWAQLPQSHFKGCDSNFEVNILKVATNKTSTLH